MPRLLSHRQRLPRARSHIDRRREKSSWQSVHSNQLYPLSFNPKTNAFLFDADCPLMPEYQRQLQDEGSEASAHLGLMSTELKRLAKADPGFLRKNFRIDTDYFDLQPLNLKALPKDDAP